MKKYLLLLLILLAGCGEKIAIPQPDGLFSISAYYEAGYFDGESSNDIVMINNILFTITDQSLVKQSLEFDEIDRVDELSSPTALCRDDNSQYVFVWESGINSMSVFTSNDLSPFVTLELPEVQSATAIVTCATGVEIDPLASTFLYIADPDSGVVHRYSWNEDGVLLPFGVLCRDGEFGARNIHTPAGMAVDFDGMLLVCDADTSRNWVVRFDPSPDMTDIIGEDNLYRGTAIMFGSASCADEVEADFTLGDARECGETDWVGGPSDQQGEFHRPTSVQVDGNGLIYVADSMNNRFQMFSADGYHDMTFGSIEMSPIPVRLSIVDWRIGSGADDVNHGAYLFSIDEETGAIRKFISSEQYIYINQEPPPPPS